MTIAILSQNSIRTDNSKRKQLLVTALLSVFWLVACDDLEADPDAGGTLGGGGLANIDSGVQATPGGNAGTGGGGAVLGGGAAGTGGGVPGAGGGAAGTGSGIPGAGGLGDAGTPGGADGGPVVGAADGGSVADAEATHADLGQGDGKDVITMGDSYMLLAVTGIQVSFEKISGRDYRNYAFPGTRMLADLIPGLIPAIPAQFGEAKAEDPTIKTVVMTGGGNDVLGSSCTSGTCSDIVDMVSTRMDALFKEMAAGGVQDVVLISYGYPTDEARHASLDYSRSIIPTRCKKTGMPRCHFIDPVKELAGKISSDGIHPTDEGYDILGKMVWDLMKAEGMRR